MARPKTHATPRSATAIRFPADLHAQLHKAADERDVSVNWLVNRAVRELLPRLLPVDEIVWTRPASPPPRCPDCAGTGAENGVTAKGVCQRCAGTGADR